MAMNNQMSRKKIFRLKACILQGAKIGRKIFSFWDAQEIDVINVLLKSYQIGQLLGIPNSQ
jgi:hypothetical protein